MAFSFFGEDIICRAKFSDGSMPHMAGGLSKQRRTRSRRPDMYEKLELSSKQDKKLLKEMEAEDAADKE